jgi:AcrR family transcriptional regulator
MSIDPVSQATEPLRRRERLRNATVAEIKRLAWAQVAEGGALGVSLRAIARDMGMTSSALYRYFDSHEQLLLELVSDGFASLADALENEESAMAPEVGPAQRWMQVARVHRRWALDHATEYALVFGSTIQRGDANPALKARHRRGVAVLFRVMVAGLASGEFRPDANLPPLRPALEAQLAEWQSDLGFELPPAALAGCLFAWTQLHGAVSLELFGQLPNVLVPADELFDQQMRAVLRGFGCTDVA